MPTPESLDRPPRATRLRDPSETTRGAQYGLLKGYGLSYIGIHNMIEGIFLNEAILGSLGIRPLLRLMMYILHDLRVRLKG